MTTNINTPNWKRCFSLYFFIGKVREKGIIGCLKIPFYKLFKNINWRLHRFLYLLSWFFPILRGSLFPFSQNKMRILGIWNFSVVPFTVGELLVFQEVALILCEIHHVDKIDIILLCDAKHKPRPDGGMDAQNFHYYFSRLLPAAFVNSKLGNLLVIDSQDMLAKYIADNYKKYYIFPPYVDKQNNKVMKSEQLFNFVLSFYAQYGYIPYLSCLPGMVRWAQQFIFATIRPRLPVTIHLRNTSTTIYRNARLECWLEFCSYCKTKYNDIIFILIGDRKEIDHRFRKLQNVFISKDYGTTIEQDMALIQTSMFYLGGSSGPGAMAIFSGLPYVIYQFRTVHENLNDRQQLPWSTPLQKLVWEYETIDRLIVDFEWLYEQIDKVQWSQHFDQVANEAAEKLKRRVHFRGNVIEGLGDQGIIY